MAGLQRRQHLAPPFARLIQPEGLRHPSLGLSESYEDHPGLQRHNPMRKPSTPSKPMTHQQRAGIASLVARAASEALLAQHA